MPSMEIEEVVEMIEEILEMSEEFEWFSPDFVVSVQKQIEEKDFVTDRQIESLQRTHTMLEEKRDG